MKKTLLTLLATMAFLPVKNSSLAEPIKYPVPTHLNDYFIKTDSQSLRVNEFNFFSNPNLTKISDSKIGKIPKESNYLSQKRFWEITDSLYQKIDVPKEITKELFHAFVEKESSFNINAYNEYSGASGLTQMRPGAWREVDQETSWVLERFTPEKNLENGLRYLKWIPSALNSMNSNFKDLSKEDKLKQIVAAYNWGIGRLEENNWDFAQAPTETQDYYEFVTEQMNKN